MNNPKVTTLTLTCGGCPTQWEGSLDTGECIYIRYRWGYLTISAAPTVDRAVSCYLVDEEARVILEQEVGNPYDGWLTAEQLVELTQSELDFSQIDLEKVEP